jgi:hypothetical protein
MFKSGKLIATDGLMASKHGASEVRRMDDPASPQ